MKPNHRFHRLIQILFILVTTPALSDLQWPLKEKTYLGGTFGEFRKNHIHAGVDISTHGKPGLPVYAGESGYLFRVKTQFLGFGKAVYIKLNNGKFLVYAHLNRFSPKIERIVKSTQQKNEKYEVDIYLKEQIPITKGELIGYSGDTGGVSPHLHIELRDKDERPLNILRYGLNIEDNTPPKISGLAICDPLSTYCIASYSIKNLPSPLDISGKTGLAVSVYDPSHGNNLGIYQIDLLVDGELLFTAKMDIFSYDEFNDNFIVYNKDLYVNKDKVYYHLFRAFGDKLQLYPSGSDGILDLTRGEHSVIINAFDHSGNKSTIRFKINYKPTTFPKKHISGKGPWFSKDKLCRVDIRDEDLYYPICVGIDTTISTKKADELIPVSNIYSIKPKEAVFKKATIFIKAPANLDKVALYKYESGKWKYMDKDTITDFGKFALFRDTTPPSIRIISTYPTFKVRIDDNGSGLDYDKLSLYIDTKKVIAEYSVSRKELFYKMPHSCRGTPMSPDATIRGTPHPKASESIGVGRGKHKIICTATDKIGNTTNKEFSL